jgi:hypothetical protein
MAFAVQIRPGVRVHLRRPRAEQESRYRAALEAQLIEAANLSGLPRLRWRHSSPQRDCGTRVAKTEQDRWDAATEACFQPFRQVAAPPSTGEVRVATSRPLCDPFQRAQPQVAFAALQAAHVGAVHAEHVREGLLAEATSRAVGPQVATEDPTAGNQERGVTRHALRRRSLDTGRVGGQEPAEWLWQDVTVR